MAQERPVCCLCGRQGVVRFRRGPHAILRCGRCGLEWCSPVASPEELRALYARDYRHEYECDYKLPQDRRRVALQLRALVRPPARVLDIGCGFGQFLDAARQVGFETHGVDPDPVRVEGARRRGHTAYVGFLEHSPAGIRWDAAVLSHVIEHVSDPVSLLRQIHERLRRGGILYVETPNFAGLRARAAGRRYAHYSPPEHITYFTRQSLVGALQRAGFRTLRAFSVSSPGDAKDVLAHYLRGHFLRRASRPTAPPPPRFVAGRLRLARISIYQAVMCAAACLSPVMGGLLGENLAALAVADVTTAGAP